MTDEKVYRETARMSTIEGDLYIENGRVEAEEEKLIVTGVIRCERDCELVGDIETTELFSHRGDVLLRGSIKSDKIELRHGRLDVSKSVITNEVRVDKSLKVDENLKAGLIRVGGSINVAIIRGEGNVRYIVREGQFIDGKYKVESISRRKVSISYNDKKFVLRLGGNNAA